jgi:hypothetical protein
MAVGPLTASAVITTLPVVVGDDDTFMVTLSNAGSTPTNVTAIVPTVTPGGAWYFSQANVVLGQTVQVGATSSLTLPVTGLFLAPARPSGAAASQPYSVSFSIYTSDGSITTTVPLNVFVSTPTEGVVGAPSGEILFVPGQLNYSFPQNAALSFFFP